MRRIIGVTKVVKFSTALKLNFNDLLDVISSVMSLSKDTDSRTATV